MIISNLDFQENITESSTVLGGAFAREVRPLRDTWTSPDGILVSEVNFNATARADGLLNAIVDFDNASVSSGPGFVGAQSLLIITATTPNANG